MVFILNKHFYLSVILLLNIVCRINAQDAFKENNLKAVMIYNFTRFMQWPDEDNIEEFNIFVMKGNTIIQPLKNIAEKKDFRGKKINVKEIRNTDKIDNCCILILWGDEKKMLGNIMNKAFSSNILIVGNEEGLAENGASVSFVKRDDKIRFEMNIASLKKAQIETNSQLLNLAVTLYGENE